MEFQKSIANRKRKFKEGDVRGKCLSLDMYGRPVALTFQGNEKFRTPIGASMTIAVLIILVCYAMFNFAKVNLMNDLSQTTLH